MFNFAHICAFLNKHICVIITHICSIQSRIYVLNCTYMRGIEGTYTRCEIPHVRARLSIIYVQFYTYMCSSKNTYMCWSNPHICDREWPYMFIYAHICVMSMHVYVQAFSTYMCILRTYICWFIYVVSIYAGFGRYMLYDICWFSSIYVASVCWYEHIYVYFRPYMLKAYMLI